MPYDLAGVQMQLVALPRCRCGVCVDRQQRKGVWRVEDDHPPPLERVEDDIPGGPYLVVRVILGLVFRPYTEPDVHVVAARVWLAHRIAEHPAEPATQPAEDAHVFSHSCIGDGDVNVGIVLERLFHGGVEDVLDRDFLPGQRPVQALARDVVPVRFGFLVAQEHQTVVQAQFLKMVNFTIDDWGHPDPCVTHRSE